MHASANTALRAVFASHGGKAGPAGPALRFASIEIARQALAHRAGTEAELEALKRILIREVEFSGGASGSIPKTRLHNAGQRAIAGAALKGDVECALLDDLDRRAV